MAVDALGFKSEDEPFTSGRHVVVKDGFDEKFLVVDLDTFVVIDAADQQDYDEPGEALSRARAFAAAKNAGEEVCCVDDVV